MKRSAFPFPARLRAAACVLAACAAAALPRAAARADDLGAFHVVRFEPSGATGGSMPNEAFAPGQAKSLRACAFTRTGHHFDGWAKFQGGPRVWADGETVTDLARTPGAQVRLWARWLPNVYSVRFHANNGSGSMSDQSFTWGESKELSANAFSRSGYRFDGWATSSGGSVAYSDRETVSNLSSTHGAVIHLYAVWSSTIDRNLVACIGDSITQGYHCDGAPWPSRLASSTGKSVLNYGVAGSTSSYGSSIVGSVLARRPGTVCILFGANDVHGHPASWTVSNLRSMVRACKSAGTRPIVATPTPQLGKWSDYNSNVSSLASAIRSMCASEGVTCVDLFSAFGSGRGYINDDGLHLTDAGGALVARRFASAL